MTRAVLACALAAGVITLGAQDRLPQMPGVDNHTRMLPQLSASFTSGAVSNVQWGADGRSFSYVHSGKSYRFDLATMKAAEAPAAPPDTAAGGPAGRGGRQGGQPVLPSGRGVQNQNQGGLQQAQKEMPKEPMSGCLATTVARGRQRECLVSPDGRLKAFYRDRNFWVANADGTGEVQVTTDGSVEKRIKNGSGSWVYGEELGQTTAIWWAPDSQRVAYYRFDESQVPDFFVGMNQTAVQTAVDIEAYPKAGAPNPIPDVFVFDAGARTSTKIDVRDGRPFGNDVVGHYVFNVRWSPDGTELLMNRTNRRQQITELAACHPATAKCRVVVREAWPTGWVDNSPPMTLLRDNRRFLWQSERNGFRNYYLYDLAGTLINPVTRLDAAEASGIVKLDEERGVMFYMARDGDNWMKMQLHRVNLDGTGDVRLTDPAFNHSVGVCTSATSGRGAAAAVPGGGTCGISADNRYFVDVYQTYDRPPSSRLVDMNGKVVGEVATGAVTLKMRSPERFSYLAADGRTTLYGLIQFPSTFDPSKKWPTLVQVYGGPASSSNVPSENYAAPASMAEYGFLVVTLGSRSAPGQGKRVLDQVYMKLGTAEMDDMADGIRALWNRPYFDKDRVGIYGTSYGGYTAVSMILRHPDVVAAASASSPVTAWYHYDSVYTERYMWIPQENKEGYESGNAMNSADKLKGRLLLYYGTADNNVHPNNSLQLIARLQRANKNFEVQVGPDQPHGSVNGQRMMEFFIENLVMRPERSLGR